jgi:hypothetical protein
MSDLNTKFGTLEAQLTAQHSELLAAIGSIAFALGAPPTAPTITLATVSSQLTAINNNLIGIAIANGSFHSALLSTLGQININSDTLINNSSLNAQRLLQAILSTACACPSDTPFIGPPLDVTPTALVDDDKCRRIQYFLSIFGAMIDGIANYGGTGAMVTAATITEILYASALAGGLVGGEVGAVGGPPGIVVGAIVGILGALIGALGSSYIFQMGSQWHQSPLPEQLLAALYAADSADAGATAFYAVVNASDVLNAPYKPLINALFWNGWANDMYGATPVVDDSAFDGSICAPTADFYIYFVANSEVIAASYGQEITINSFDATSTEPANPYAIGLYFYSDADHTTPLCVRVTTLALFGYTPAANPGSTAYGVQWCDSSSYYGQTFPDFEAAQGVKSLSLNSYSAFSMVIEGQIPGV